MSQYTKYWSPYRGAFESAKNGFLEKSYSTPPNLYLKTQPPNLPQFLPLEALDKGTLWKYFYDPYVSPYEKVKE